MPFVFQAATLLLDQEQVPTADVDAVAQESHPVTEAAPAAVQELPAFGGQGGQVQPATSTLDAVDLDQGCRLLRHFRTGPKVCLLASHIIS